ncbi:MAG TPA: site-2 protease family protein [Verrucomicrobiae bacterium]|nr:site-2 protease family protein [Verrucomicrobiae bacterium]
MEVFIVVTVLWIFSVCMHEFGHALVAYWGGDHTVKDKGYLTLNPFHYTHPVYSILIPVLMVVMGGIGLPGGAVYIEHQLLRSRTWETAVALAGIAINWLMVLFLAAFFKLGIIPNDPTNLACVSFGLLLQLEVGAILLNLIPIPPLDGFQAIAPWLPRNLRDQLFSMSNMSMWILFLALWYVTPINQAFWNSIWFITDHLGVDSYTTYVVGMHAFRFWER